MSSVIGKGPAGEIYVGGAGVVNLNPIREGAIEIGQSGFVIRHEFADDDLGGARAGKAEWEQKAEEDRNRGFHLRKPGNDTKAN